jgi:hypothetical protein
MCVDGRTAVLICAGPSLDRLSAAAWAAIQGAAAVVAVNGALVAEACRTHHVRLTYAAAMDVRLGLGAKVSGFAAEWSLTPAWRVTAATSEPCEGESFVREVEWWSDDPDEGYVGGSTAMVVGNWLCNPWPRDAAARVRHEAAARLSGKAVPPRGFRRLAYVGLDMIPGEGAHARGAGVHASGFSDSPRRYETVTGGWRLFCAAAAQRGIEVVNLSPGSGLRSMPHLAVPASWLRVQPAIKQSSPSGCSGVKSVPQ